MSSVGHDGDNRIATVEDLRGLLEEHTQRHREEISMIRSMLHELSLELRSRREPLGADVKNSAPTLATTQPDGSPQGSSLAADGGADDGDLAAPVTRVCSDSRMAAHGSLLSSASMLLGVKAARFDMAKALGFSSAQDPAQSEEAIAVSSKSPDATKGLKGKPQWKKSSSFISSHAAIHAKKDYTAFQRFVRSAIFENLSGGVICINALVIGAHANLRALHPDRCYNDWDVVFLLFNCFFIVELIMRISIYRGEFIFGPDFRWNFFDSAIVFAGLLEEIITRAIGHQGCIFQEESPSSDSNVITGITVLRVLRAVRVIRIIKAIRTMSIFKDLRIMVTSTVGCLVPLAWACLLLGFIQWCFSVYFLHLATDHISKAIHDFGIEVLSDSSKPYKDLRDHFGSLWSSLFTLFQSITGGIDWDKPSDAIFKATGEYHPLVLFMVFIALTLFAVLNVITGVFVENATQAAMQDRELMIEAALANRHQYQQAVLEVFREADVDGSGQLTISEFAGHLEDPRVQAFLENLGLDSMGARRMFRLLDLDGNGLVSAEEFVTGCMCLKGGAKTLDIAALLLELNKMSGKLSRSMIKLERRWNVDSPAMAGPGAPYGTVAV